MRVWVTETYIHIKVILLLLPKIHQHILRTVRPPLERVQRKVSVQNTELGAASKTFGFKEEWDILAHFHGWYRSRESGHCHSGRSCAKA